MVNDDCVMERRDCASTVQELANSVTRQVVITEERVLPALDRVEKLMEKEADRIENHEIRLVKVEGFQDNTKTWSRRGWVVFSALFIGLILAAAKAHFG